MSTTEPEAIEEESSRGAEILLEVATPEIYQQNAFRILGLPVDATPRDIARHAERLQLRARLGSAVPAAEGILPLEPAPSIDMIRDAMQRLRDPEKRFIDEFFWFWPAQFGESRTDPALTALASGNPQTAVDIWRAQEQAGEEGAIAMHNLAILGHMMALEPDTARQLRSSPQHKDIHADVYWREAFQRWRALCEHEGFWRQLTARIQELDDPRLTTALVPRVRTTLPVTLLSINAQLTLRSAERRDRQEVIHHTHLMRAAGLEPTALEEALGRAVVPVRERLKTLCQAVTPQIDAEPTQADQVITRFVDQARPLLDALDALLPANHPIRVSVHDDVALNAFEGVVHFGNTTGHWQRTRTLLGWLSNIAASQSARRRIQESSEIVERNIHESRNIQESSEIAEHNLADTICWYCKKRTPDESAAVEKEMNRTISRESIDTGTTRIQYETETVTIPRCSTCKSFHARQASYAKWWGLWGALLGAVFLGGWFLMFIYSLEYGEPRHPPPGCTVEKLPETHRLLPPPLRGWVLLFIASPIPEYTPTSPKHTCDYSKRSFAERFFGIIFFGGLSGLLSGLVGAVFGELVGSRVASILHTEGIPSMRAWVDFPHVRQLRAQGWILGSKPPGVQ